MGGGLVFCAVLLSAGVCMADADDLMHPTKPVETWANGAVDPYESLKGVELIGTVPTRHSRDIADSPVSIGFECLDRCAFEPRHFFKFAGMCGAKHSRAMSGWNRCEREKGRYEFAWLDEVVDGLAAEGVEAWLVCSYGNPLYTPCGKFAKQIEECKAKGEMVPGWARGYVGEAPYLHGPEAERAWLAYLHAMARHFRGRVRTWELWNEPEWFWRKDNVPMEGELMKPAIDAYVRFLRESAAAIREEIPDAKIGFDFAALSSEWTAQLAKAKVVEFIDIFMFHGYETYPEAGFQEAVEQMKALYRRADGSTFEFWQGESGRATGRANNGLCLPTEFSQARFIARRIATDVKAGMKVSNIFTITDFIKYYPDGRDQFYGIVHGQTRQPKHGFRTLQAMGWLCDGIRPAPENWICFMTPSNKQFVDTIPYAAVKVAAFERKGIPMYAFWQPQHVEIGAAPVCGRVQMVLGKGGKPFENPVLIDPVRCKVWDVKSLFAPARRYGAWELKGIFALDYPLFLTDRTALEK